MDERGETLVTFALFEKRLGADVHDLHDSLWNPGREIDRAKLMAKLRRDAGDLDAFLQVAGKLRRIAAPLIAEAEKDKERGGALFELLEETFGLTIAAEHVRKGTYSKAGPLVANAVESMSIGTCSALDHFEIVEEWESGKIDFETYARKLADFLEARGVALGPQYMRTVGATVRAGRQWDDKAPKDLQAIAACALVMNGAWCSLATNAVREALGWPRRFAGKDFSSVVSRIVARV